MKFEIGSSGSFDLQEGQFIDQLSVKPHAFFIKRIVFHGQSNNKTSSHSTCPGTIVIPVLNTVIDRSTAASVEFAILVAKLKTTLNKFMPT